MGAVTIDLPAELLALLGSEEEARQGAKVALVLDSSALITLARIGRLDLLRQVARAVHISEAVYEEVVQRESVNANRQPSKGSAQLIRHPCPRL